MINLLNFNKKKMMIRMLSNRVGIYSKYYMCFLVLLLAFQLKAQEKYKANAIVHDVTIFTNGAELVNKVNVNLPKGSSKLYIQNVARDIDINTVQISGPDGITVLSISQALQEEVEIINPAHRKIKDSLEMTLLRREVLLNKQSAISGALKILNKDELLGAGKVDLNDLTKIVDYYQVKSFELNSSLASIKKSIAEEDKIIRKLQDNMRSFTGIGGQIVIQMNNANPIRSELRLSYITYSANWQAYYDLKAKSITSPLEILYKAKVSQNTGVDWKNVKLMLSTGNPTQSGTMPILSASYARYIDLSSMVVNQARLQNSISGRMVNKREDAKLDLAPAYSMEVASSPLTTIVEHQLNATFDIDVPYDIASNGEPHSVTLKEFSQPASFKYYAVPKLEKEAFLLAEIKDFERLNLVPGEANVIFENIFVGSSYLNTNVTTDTLSLSIGRDKSISIKRDRIMDAKSSQTSGSSRKQTYTYDLRVRNGKANAIDLILKDQFPISTDKSIEIELVDNGGAIVNKELGILSWPIHIKAGEMKTYRFTFTVKSPKDKSVTFY